MLRICNECEDPDAERAEDVADEGADAGADNGAEAVISGVRVYCLLSSS